MDTRIITMGRADTTTFTLTKRPPADIRQTGS